MKKIMLISASTNLPVSISGSRVSSPICDTIDDNPNKLYTYLHQLAGSNEMEVDVILKDHCYARPWNWKPENVYVKPIKKLFFSKKSATLDKPGEDEEVDVECIVNNKLTPPVDLTRVKHLMDELQRLASFARPDETNEWEEQIDKILWSSVQHRIFTKVIKILNSERLSRLARASSSIEPIFRRTSVDIAARRFREALASAGWDWRLAQWLHGLLFDYLPQEYLGIYLDILQTLRLRIPQLIDKMIAVQPNISAKAGSITWETLGSLLKRSWDPIVPSLGGSRLKKLPGNPILIITPSGIGTSMSSRQHKWISLLGTLGMVVTVHSHLGIAANRITMMVCIDQLVQATRTKIQDIRNDCPGRPIILVGFNTGAALACQVAQMEHVSAVICLGFPFSTAEGKRGTPDDTLMDVRCPVMFIIGQNATLVRPDDLEDLREKMLVETSLVVVGTADDNLRISTTKKISEGITQSMVDRCILDEIGDFVGSILLQPHPLPLRTTLKSSYENKNSRKEQRKRRNSTSSSVESEPNSPTVKKSRPNTPISSGVPVALNTTTNPTSKPGAYNPQSNLIGVAQSQVGGHITTVKRKPRSASSTQKTTQYVEHLVASRMSAQHNAVSENGGITLNIGSLASLAPVGPIRLAPASGGQHTATMPKSTAKALVSAGKVPKITSNLPLQSGQKMKVVSTGKGFSKMISANYRHGNIIETNSDNKHGEVFSSGSQVKINVPITTMAHNKSLINASGGSISNVIQNGKNSLAMSGGLSSTRTSPLSNVLLTPNSSAANSLTTTAPTTSKVTDNMGATGSSSNAMHNSAISLDTPKMSELPRQVTICNRNDNLHNTPSGNIVMIDNSSNTRNVCSSVMAPFASHNSDSIQALSGKPKTSNKTVKVMPKITVNASNLQRLQKSKTPQALQKKALTADIDDELGNILDIPIIFAKDDETINNIEKNPPFTNLAFPADSQDRPASKVGTSTKVVLISNKQDKQQQSTSKLTTPSTQTIICPSVSMQNLNHVVLQTRPQHPTIAARPRPAPMPRVRMRQQPTIKYTKIILAKRNSQGTLSNLKTEPIIVTRTNDSYRSRKLLNYEKTEHRYAQMPPNIVAKKEPKLVDETLEIEDAIRSNVIERKPIPEIDLTSPTKSDDSQKSPANKGLSIAVDLNSKISNELINSKS